MPQGVGEVRHRAEDLFAEQAGTDRPRADVSWRGVEGRGELPTRAR